jgi:hypothetical protein
MARSVFHGMLIHGAGLERRQAFLFRIVDIGIELFAMAATCSHAHSMRSRNELEAARAIELADVFCRGARRRIDEWFSALWRNDDVAKVGVTRALLAGDHAWLERRGLPAGPPRPLAQPPPLPATARS